jgi:hypothetical protein
MWNSEYRSALVSLRSTNGNCRGTSAVSTPRVLADRARPFGRPARPRQPVVGPRTGRQRRIPDRVWEWWTDVASARLAPGAPVVLVFTGWNEDDRWPTLVRRRRSSVVQA